jgi:hypothetical protein
MVLGGDERLDGPAKQLGAADLQLAGLVGHEACGTERQPNSDKLDHFA